MTHSLHRMGSPEELKNDICFIFAPAKGINEAGSADKARRFLELVRKHGAVHYGDDLTGNVLTRGHQGLVAGARDLTNIHCVFSDVSRALAFLEDVVKADLGISVVMTGLFEQVGECCRAVGLQPHTVEYSMGIWGRRTLLPDEDTLKVTTMCGHGLVAASLVAQAVKEVAAGKRRARWWAERMARLCLCGIFNPDRAEMLLQRMADSLRTSEGG